MVLDAALLNTQHYKVQIKCKVEQSREWMIGWLFGFGILTFIGYLMLKIYMFNQRFLNEYLVDNILDKQDLICLQRIE